MKFPLSPGARFSGAKGVVEWFCVGEVLYSLFINREAVIADRGKDDFYDKP